MKEEKKIKPMTCKSKALYSAKEGGKEWKDKMKIEKKRLK